MKSTASAATLIGDVVSSRRAADRPRLHDALEAALASLNRDLAPATPLRVTVGDEFQGGFADLGSAVAAAWRLHWALVGRAELRHGLGWGPVTVLRDDPRVEDGPGWWAARAAIEAVKAEASRSATRHVRTAYRRAEGPEGAEGPGPEAVNAALLCRDHMVGSLSERSRRILALLVAGRTQAEIAETEGITASAVSQRVRRDGLVVITTAEEMLEGLR